ncbi:Bulb-type lectin domain [Dillenia turbinata]|uniref:Bulb-type lectin domain n=1 Tax=Dillenia turbinata TaxID=194707 RepID=A0AAN8ZVK5_9MAGN
MCREARYGLVEVEVEVLNETETHIRCYSYMLRHGTLLELEVSIDDLADKKESSVQFPSSIGIKENVDSSCHKARVSYVQWHKAQASNGHDLDATKTNPATLDSLDSPKNSSDGYLGIWFGMTTEQTAVWVANREEPMKDSSGILKKPQDGNLAVVDGNEVVHWSSITSLVSKNPVPELQDSENLILRNGN